VQHNKDGGPLLSKLFGLFSLAISLSVTQLNAGSFENFKKMQTESFKKYKDERDNAFSKYLKEEWSAYQAQQGKKLYEEQKPTKLPKKRFVPMEEVGPKVNIKVAKELPQKFPKVIIIKKEKIKKEKIVQNDVYIDFFGSGYSFNIAQGLKKSNFFPRNTNGVSNFFNVVASSNYKELIEEIKQIKNRLKFNDWALYLLVNKISHTVHKNQDNANLMTWFIFNKLGYAVKVGLAHKHIVLMYYSKKVIYSTPSYSFKKKKFYVIANYAKNGVGSLYSYPQNYPHSNRPLDLSLKVLPKFEDAMKYKDLSFVEGTKKYSVGFNYNQNLIDFMATYPQADYETYFNAPLQKNTYDEIATKLKSYVDGKKMSDAINFVLHFVQKSFAYQVDEAQFGREKVMFAQETLYYNKSDCEDRAILFCSLVRRLFQIGVVGVKYKDHMSTALYIPLSGDSVRTASHRFVIADPTYINANIGQNMPKYRSLRPESFVLVR